MVVLHLKLSVSALSKAKKINNELNFKSRKEQYEKLIDSAQHLSCAVTDIMGT